MHVKAHVYGILDVVCSLFLVLTGCNVAMSINSLTYNTNAISDLTFSYQILLLKMSTTREETDIWLGHSNSDLMLSYCHYKYIILQAYMSLNAHSDYFVLTSWVHATIACLSFALEAATNAILHAWLSFVHLAT